MSNLLPRQKRHLQVISEFMVYLNHRSKLYILKGGTALMLCYNLTRFSEDIDLDGFAQDINDIVDEFCNLHKFTYRIAKNTKTVKRFMVHYGEDKPLKIEVSYRLKSNDIFSETNTINGVLVYTVQRLMHLKLGAYEGRDKIRDLFDVVFIGTHYWGLLDKPLIYRLRDTLAYKGIEQFDYLVATQRDELIDNNLLAERFLSLWDKLGLN